MRLNRETGIFTINEGGYFATFHMLWKLRYARLHVRLWVRGREFVLHWMRGEWPRFSYTRHKVLPMTR
jgi:hypothetical protein